LSPSIACTGVWTSRPSADSTAGPLLLYDVQPWLSWLQAVPLTLTKRAL
jgi:hypothetical protein